MHKNLVCVTRFKKVKHGQLSSINESWPYFVPYAAYLMKNIVVCPTLYITSSLPYHQKFAKLT